MYLSLSLYIYIYRYLSLSLSIYIYIMLMYLSHSLSLSIYIYTYVYAYSTYIPPPRPDRTAGPDPPRPSRPGRPRPGRVSWSIRGWWTTGGEAPTVVIWFPENHREQILSCCVIGNCFCMSGIFWTPPTC